MWGICNCNILSRVILGSVASSLSSALLQELSTSVVEPHRTPTSDNSAPLRFNDIWVYFHVYLILLYRIWTQMEWNVKYVHTMSGLSNIFTDGRFLKMSYKAVKFYEKKLLFHCIHACWKAEINVGWLPEKSKSLKSWAVWSMVVGLKFLMDCIPLTERNHSMRMGQEHC